MLNNLIDINSIPLNIAIYKKVDGDFIFVDFNKERSKYKDHE